MQCIYLFIHLCLKVDAHLFLLFIWFLKVFECEPCSATGWCERVITIFLPTTGAQTFFWLLAQFHLGHSGKSREMFALAEKKTSLFNWRFVLDMKLLLLSMYSMPMCMSIKYKRILGFFVIIPISTLKSYFSIEGGVLMRQELCVCLSPASYSCFPSFFVHSGNFWMAIV